MPARVLLGREDVAPFLCCLIPDASYAKISGISGMIIAREPRKKAK